MFCINKKIFKEILEGKFLPARMTYVVVPLTIMLIGCIYLAMTNEGNKVVAVAVIKKDKDSKNKLVDLAYEVYYYFWENEKPKPTEELKAITYFQRLWNYVMH